MPNWCVGTLRVRGKTKDLKRFILEGLQPAGFMGNSLEPLKPEANEDYFEISSSETCYIENTRRGFVEDLYVYLDGAEDEVQSIAIESKFAWGINAEELKATCIKYNVDMKIHAFERGMEFNQNIEIVGGLIIKDEEIKFDDYNWECICPNMGG